VSVANASLTKVVNCSIFDNKPRIQDATQAYGVYMAPESRGTIVANCVLHPNRQGAFVDKGALNRIYGNSENNETHPDSTMHPVDDVTHMKATFLFDKAINVPSLLLGSNGPTISHGSGAPAPSVTAANGSLYLRSDAAGPNLYVMQNGAWVAK
jgi:hypothetical protein